ncbi:DsrE family protein [Danxiaibacter flavus]|uniref:DsrE family protein n=1 Tax=Danxiaibacter flavus TaxID=3049108 RepID=A0ABV3ZBD1_9BACT|nr:DsrE family protein [Chitinophagaceae bacterium DXS]
MKYYLVLFVVALLSIQIAVAQSRPYNVVFDLTTKDSVSQQSVIRWINLISKNNADAKLEVVMYGQGLDLVTKGKSIVADDVTKLAQNKNVSFAVCDIAMKHQNVDKSQLLPGVTTVPDGIYEIITKQGEGWGYIKVTH